jgi:hypothetical protein
MQLRDALCEALSHLPFKEPKELPKHRSVVDRAARVHHGSHFAEQAYQGRADQVVVAAAAEGESDGGAFRVQMQRWRLTPTEADRQAIFEAENALQLLTDPAKLSTFAQSRGLLWDPPAAQKFAQAISAKEATFRELAKHHFPNIYKELRTPVQPTAQQTVQQAAFEQMSSLPPLLRGTVMPPQVPPAIPSNIAIREIDPTQQIDQASSIRLPQGKSGSSSHSSYRGQPHSRPRVVVSPTTRKRYDENNARKKLKREQAKKTL